MKLEYFGDALDGDGVLLLYEGSAAEVGRLRVALRAFCVVGQNIALHALEFIDAVNGCEVIAQSAATGSGLRAVPDQPRFHWVLSPSEWEQAAARLGPFCEATTDGASGRFQYLHDHGGPQVIYSMVRGW